MVERLLTQVVELEVLEAIIFLKREVTVEREVQVVQQIMRIINMLGHLVTVKEVTHGLMPEMEEVVAVTQEGAAEVLSQMVKVVQEEVRSYIQTQVLSRVPIPGM